MHWADVIAQELQLRGDRQLISTGISPSGFIHVGSLREAITAEAVRKALVNMDAPVRMIYLVDSFDPLRRRYSFLPDEFENHVGRPISQIPCPCGSHDSYAHHFIQPLLDSLDELGVHCDVHWTDSLYAEGRFTETIDAVFRNRPRVVEILREVTGRDVDADYVPYTPRCSACGRLTETKVLEYKFPYVEYVCTCGNEGRADIRTDQGKLPWRLEWPAKWKIFGVTCEPFGKDHAAAGGSYDSGAVFAREIFGIEPPRPIPYEFVQLKGKGQMHKSAGASVTGIDAIRMVPASVLNYNIIKYNPERHIDYDSGMGLLDIVDEYDRIETLYFEGGADEKDMDHLRAYELSQPHGVRDHLPFHVPYRHLVNVVQIAEDFEGILGVLGRTDDAGVMEQRDVDVLQQRVECVHYWLNSFAPEMVKFSLLDSLPDVDLVEAEVDYLRTLRPELTSIQWVGDMVHDAVYGAAKAQGLGAKKAFQVLYRIFIARRSGPRLGHFLATLDRDFVLDRIDDAVSTYARRD